MYPHPFTYLAPRSLDEAVELLARHELDDAKVLAGGQSLIPLMKLRFAEPGYLVDLGGVPGLDSVAEQDGWLRLGALTRERAVERSRVVRDRYPVLLDTASVIADPVVRNLATVGGNLAHGDPANDHPATMVALGARVVAVGPQRTRTIAVEDLFVGLYETSLEPTEVLTEIRVPSPPHRHGSAYVKFERQVGDFAVAATAVALRAEDGSVRDPRIVLTNVASTPHRAEAAERLLEGRRVSEDVFREAAHAAGRSFESGEDAAYRQRVATAVTHKALWDAWRRTGEAGP